MLVGYARCSTDQQQTAAQVQALIAAGCDKVFEDVASGASSQRSGLDDALAFMRDGDTLVVWRLDRLGRSVRQLIDVVDSLGRRGIGVRSLTEQIDTATPNGTLLFHLFGALAQFERELIRERTLLGLDRARREGRKGGRPRSLSEKDIVAARALLSDRSLSMRDVASRLGVAPVTLYRAVGRRDTPADRPNPGSSVKASDDLLAGGTLREQP